MNKSKAKLVAIIILAIIIVIVVWAGGVIFINHEEAKEPVEITILHTNDIHANVSDDNNKIIGFAKFATYAKNLKAENKHVLILDAGDMFQGLPFANLEKGHSIIDLANAVGYDAMTVGNHEFDFGADNLLEIVNQLNYPVIAANIYDENGAPAFEAYIVKKLEGVKVGIFGMATEETTFKTHPDNVAGYIFTDMIEEAKKNVDILRNEELVDVVIMLSHLGLYEGDYTSDVVAKAVDGIDIIIDGHSHTELPEGLLVNQTLIASTGTAFNNVGEIKLTVQDGKVIQKNARLLDYAAFREVDPDAEVLAKIAQVTANQEAVLNQVVGESAVTLEGTRETVRTSETNLGQLIVDAMRDLTHANVAIMNGGGIRASIEPGPITMKEIVTVLPYGNTVMVKEVKGSDIVAALEHSVSEYPNEKGGFLHISGMTFTFDPSQEVGQRMREVKIDGAPLDTDAMYTVAMPDFIAAGGDDFTMFTSYPVQAEYNTLMDTLIDYVAKTGTVQGVFEERIFVVDEPNVNAAA